MEVTHQYVDEAAKSIVDSRAKRRFVNAVTKIGRPTNYSEEICIDLLASRANGNTIVQACLDVGIARSTYYKWTHEIPAFMDMHKKGQDLARSYDEDLVRDNYDNRNFGFLAFESQFKRRHNCSESAPIDCPGFSEENSDDDNIKAILKGIADKQVSPDDAAKLMSLIKTKQEVTVQQEILLRMDQLEHMIKNN